MGFADKVPAFESGSRFFIGTMKSQKTEKRFEARKSVKTHQARNGKTVGAVIDQAGITPAAMSAILENATHPGDAFHDWLESMPPVPAGGEHIRVQMEIDLRPYDWTVLAQVAKSKGWQVADVVDWLLSSAVMELMNGEEIDGLALGGAR